MPHTTRCLASLRCSLVAALCLLAPHRIEAQDSVASDVARFLAGGAAAFGIHEGGHLAFDLLFDADPEIEAVHYGPLPFFAIAPTAPISPRQRYTIAAAGFWTQMLTSDLLRPPHRDLRHEHAPFAKGMLTFDVLTSIGYAAVAFSGTGPSQRDTLGMAAGARISERTAGAIVLAPAAIAVYRYFRPESRWARWAERAAAVGSVALVMKPD